MMIKKILNAFLRKSGCRLARFLPVALAGKASWVETFIGKISQTPSIPELHLQYSVAASRKKRPFLAYAELKSAEWLGADREEIKRYESSFRAALPDLRRMNHNQYYRLMTLASVIRNRPGGGILSVLDVGGGQGQLASFIPEMPYCLADPGTNGISGTRLPFSDSAFDYVVSCHVLEHIPVDQREDFLDQLLAKAKRGIILLNPFHQEGTHVDERLRLVIEITGAPWAREHLECTLPKVEEVRSFADRRGLRFSAEPNGTLTTTMSLVFLDYFAARSGLLEEWGKMNAFLNEKCRHLLDSPDYPTAYLVVLEKADGCTKPDGQ